MTDKSLHERLNSLDARSKAVAPSETKELQNIQSELDDIFDNFVHYKNHGEYEYFLYEIQARLHYIHGRFDEAEKFCDEAIRLVGAEYPDAKWLKRMISKGRLHEWGMSSKESALKNLRDEKSKLEMYLAFAVIGLFIFVPLYFGANSSGSRKTEMIDACVSDISEAQDNISSLNDSFDEISSDASNASGSDYEEQESTLDDISSKASDAKLDAPSADCSQDDGDNSSSD